MLTLKGAAGLHQKMEVARQALLFDTGPTISSPEANTVLVWELLSMVSVYAKPSQDCFAFCD